jgi:predicted hydrocarbon binding protein
VMDESGVNMQDRETIWHYVKKTAPAQIITVILLVISFIAGGLILGIPSKSEMKENVGVLAVKYMYQFGDVDELDNNMEALKVITSEEVYSNLTIDNTDKALRVYLKFNNNPVIVNVEDIGKDYVVYSLHTESISSFRKFVFFFETGKGGKIVKAREGELLDFGYGAVPG